MMAKTGKKVLIVDDEIDNAKSLSRPLERRGYTSLIATNAADALKLYKEELPKAVITDFQLGGALILLVSGDYINDWKNMEADGFYFKPLSSESFDDMHDRITRYCNGE